MREELEKKRIAEVKKARRGREDEKENEKLKYYAAKRRLFHLKNKLDSDSE